VTTIDVIRIDLELESAGGVTAPETDDVIDLPLAHDADRNPYVPPASLAGGLRSHFGDDAEELLGPGPGQGGAGDGPVGSSPLWLLGSEVLLPDGAGPFTVQSTAIDPHRAAAQVSTLRTRQLLPAGTTIRCFLRLKPELTTRAVDTIVSWRPVVGRGRTSGAGRARVTAVGWRRLDLRSRTGPSDWLLGGRAGLFPTDLTRYDGHRLVPARARPPALRLELQVMDALAVGARTDGQLRLLRTTSGAGGGTPVIPGTTWKGVLRSRCAYILRSCGGPICDPPPPVPGRRPAPHRPCGACPICRLFGYTSSDALRGEPVGRAGQLELSDTVLADAPPLRVRNHVAIDRFTGGARDGLLFTQQVVVAGTATLEIHARQPLADGDRGLLLLAIRDIDEGYLGIGGATTRGCGTLRLTAPSRAVLDELHENHRVGRAVRDLLGGAA
jgi:CRISPR/Cas system CSM-associated protein Csm3 (group 7 of RAMP superfamily)